MSAHSTQFIIPRKPVIARHREADTSNDDQHPRRKLSDGEEASEMDNDSLILPEQVSLPDQPPPVDISSKQLVSTMTAEAHDPDLEFNQSGERDDSFRKLSDPCRMQRRRQCHACVFGEGWSLEILFWVVAVACIATIVAVLWEHDNQPLPQWPYNITLNTFVSTFSTIGKASLMFIVAQSLGQLKWAWYSTKSAPLADFDTLDSASRGPIGSFQLLAFTKGKCLASLGAFITIAALATIPFSQQVITYPERKAQSGTASLSQSTNYIIPETDSLNTANLFTQQMLQSLYQGLFSADQHVSPLAPSCSTGNCSWPSYKSWAISSQANNITNLLHVSNCFSTYQNLDLPPREILPTSSITPQERVASTTEKFCNYSLEISTGPALKNASVTLDLNTQLITLEPMVFFYDDFWTWASIFIIYWDPFLGSVQAVNFSLTACIQSYTTQVINNIASTILTETWTYDNLTKIFNNNTGRYELSSPRDKSTFYIDLVFLNLAATSWLYLQGTIYSLDPDFPEEYASEIYMEAMYYNSGSSGAAQAVCAIWFPGETPAFDTISTIGQNIATSLTNDLKNISWMNQPLPGTAYTNQTYVKVRWGWLAYLFSLFALTTLFLLLTIFEHHVQGSRHYSKEMKQTPRVRLWKNSALAAIWALRQNTSKYHAFGSSEEQDEGGRDDDGGALAYLQGLKEMSAVAEGVHVRLRKLEGVRDGWVLERDEH